MKLRLRVEVECDRAGMSRAELARLIGIRPQALNDRLARGDMKASLLKKIANVLKVPMEILLTEVTAEEYAAAKTLAMEKNKNKVFGDSGAEAGFFK